MDWAGGAVYPSVSTGVTAADLMKEGVASLIRLTPLAGAEAHVAGEGGPVTKEPATVSK